MVLGKSSILFIYFFLNVDICFSQNHLLKGLSFPWTGPDSLSKIVWPRMRGSTSGLRILPRRSAFLSWWYQHHTLWVTEVLKSEVWVLQLCSSLPRWFRLRGRPSRFHVNCRTGFLFLQGKKRIWHFDRGCTKSVELFVTLTF